MKKISILFSIALFLSVFSCEQEDKLSSQKSVDSNIIIDQNSKIDLVQTTLTKEQIENGSCGNSKTVAFLAGQHIDVGDIIISNDDNNLYITYDLEGGNWWLKETHLFVGNYDAIPFNGGGNPKIGHFPYHGDHGQTQNYVFTIPLDKLEDCFEIIAHAEVVQIEGGQTIGSETAFGIGDGEFPGSRWGWYISHCEQECDACMDGFAFNLADTAKSTCFIDDGFNQWGWTNEFVYSELKNYQLNNTSNYQIPIYANAQVCDYTKSMEIGYLEINVHGGDGKFYANIKYEITNRDYKITEVNLNIDSEKYPKDGDGKDTVIPAYYTYSIDDLNGFSHSIDDIVWPTSIDEIAFIIAHVTVCKIEES